MKKNFLEILRQKRKKNKTLAVLAPMADVTDFVFREMISKYSKNINENNLGPDIFWTEFVSADGLCHPEGKKKLLIDLKFNKKTQRPILAQIFGSRIENIKEAVKIVYDLGYDGVDLNFGCPDKTIEKQGCGSGMIKTPDLAREVILAAKEIKNDSKKFFSVSVKTRLGYNKIEYETWFPNVLDCEPDIFTVHLRTRKEMSLVDAHWEISKKVVSFIKEYCKKNKLKMPFIILNGDVKDLVEAEKKIKMSDCDAVMIGRGVFGTPWLFNKKEYLKRKIILNPKTKIEINKNKENILFRLNVMLEHTKNFEKILTKHKSFNIMKKHYKAYINNFDGAKELRVELMDSKNYKEIKKITDKFISENMLK